MNSDCKNWTEVAIKEGLTKERKLDKNYQNHLVKPCSMIVIIGSTGSGKSNAICELIYRKNKAFSRIIILSNGKSNEAINKLLKKHVEGIEIIEDINKLPPLSEFADDMDTEKLLIFDDCNNNTKKELNIVGNYFNTSRVFGFTCICLAQNFTAVPPQVRRNCNYVCLFKIHDNNIVNTILRTINTDGIPKKELLEKYHDCCKNHDFLTISTTSLPILRRNWNGDI